ncbi:MAG TPA: hypothetical protein VHF87_11135 [Methylomirabilota bacterium]|nr:hypothetical protein [Methylomirabilota bacterium]
MERAEAPSRLPEAAKVAGQVVRRIHGQDPGLDQLGAVAAHGGDDRVDDRPGPAGLTDPENHGAEVFASNLGDGEVSDSNTITKSVFV